MAWTSSHMMMTISSPSGLNSFFDLQRARRGGGAHIHLSLFSTIFRSRLVEICQSGRDTRESGAVADDERQARVNTSG